MGPFVYLVAMSALATETPIQWAQRAYNEAFLVFADDGAPQAKFGEAISRYQRLRETGVSDKITAPALARLLLETGRSKNAEDEWDRWEKADPSHEAELFGERLRRYQQQEFRFFNLVPNSLRILKVAPINVKGEEVWVALTARKDDGEEKELDSVYNRTNLVGSTLWVESTIGLKSFVLTDSRFDFDKDSKFNQSNEVTLIGRDIDGDGNEEIILEGVIYGASWTPSCLNVFQYGESGWTRVGDQLSHDPLSNHQFGKKQRAFRSVQAIGSTLSHSAQPRFPSYRTLVKGKWVDCGEQFKADYAEQLAEIKRALASTKDDYDLLAHQGMALAYLRRKEEAKKAFGAAASVLIKEFKSAKNLEPTDVAVMKQQIGEYMLRSQKG